MKTYPQESKISTTQTIKNEGQPLHFGKVDINLKVDKDASRIDISGGNLKFVKIESQQSMGNKKNTTSTPTKSTPLISSRVSGFLLKEHYIDALESDPDFESHPAPDLDSHKLNPNYNLGA